MTAYRNSRSRRAQARIRTAKSEIDGFGTWISVLVVFAAVMAVIVVRQNFNDHAYSVASNAEPHAIVSTVAAR